jgi:hypothetical protein
MKALSYILFLLAATFTLDAARLFAQAGGAAAVDATVGGAAGKGGEFYDRDVGGARVAVSFRRWSTPHVGAFGELSMDWLGLSTAHYLVCYESSRGGCMESYPELSGPAAILGLIGGTVNRRFEARVGAGAGAYAADGTRVGAVVSQVDAAAFPVAHVGLIIGARWIVVPRYRADRLSMLPWTIGMRVR